jgi:hypothetical protein
MNKNRSFNWSNSTFFRKYDAFQITSITIDTFGIIGNLICMIVAILIIINRKNNKIRDTILHFNTQIERQGWYLLLLSCFYFFTFLLIIIKHATQQFNLRYGFLFIILLFSEPICKIVSSWILVAFSFDTVNNIVTHRPELTKIYKLLNPKYLFVFIFIIVIPLYTGLVFPIYYSQFYQAKIKNYTKNMSYNNFNQRKKIDNVLISGTYVFLNLIIPFILIGISTTVLVKRILKRREHIQSSVHRKKLKFVVRMISMNLFFFICNLPLNCLFIYFYFCEFNSNQNDVYCYSGKFIGVYAFFSYRIDYAHRASLIIILLFTNKLFRKEFLKMFCYRKV